MKAYRSLCKLLALIWLVLSACAPAAQKVPTEEFSPDKAPLYHKTMPGYDLILTGSVRIELPKYRVRGSCSITKYPDGMVMVEFIHSSLFGSYREEATIYVEDGLMTIHDLRRGQVWQSGEATGMLSRNLGMEVFPDDLAQILLLEALETMPAGTRSPSGGEDQAEALTWRGRTISQGFDDRGRRKWIKICDASGNPCYEIKYGYGDARLIPEKITVSNMSGPERLSLVITGIVEEVLTGDQTDAKM